MWDELLEEESRKKKQIRHKYEKSNKDIVRGAPKVGLPPPPKQ